MGQPADLVFKSGKVVTIDAALPQAEAVVILGNRIAFVGANSEAEKWVGPKTKVVDLQGKLLLPGFNDAHCHLVSGGFSLLRVNLAGAKTLKEIQEKVGAAVKKAPKGAWVQGRGWDHTLFNKGEWPTKEMLDAAAPNTPVYLRRIDGHVSWVNSAALKAAKITKNTPDTAGGEIVRDKSGNPTGIFKELADDLVARAIPEPSYAELRQAVETGLLEARRLGVTSLQEISTSAAIVVYNDLLKGGKLTARISSWLSLDTVKHISSYAEVRKSFPADSSVLKLGLLKALADGTMGSRTAMFFQPYSDDSSTTGIPHYTQEELERLVFAADSMGFQVGIHAIGDSGNFVALLAYSQAILQNQPRERRHRIEHAQLVRLADISAFKELGIITSMQPTHCTSDMRWAEARAGKERCKGAYAWRSFLNAGVPLAFGTDWAVEPLNPMGGLYAATTRQDLETGQPEGGWFPEQRLSMMEAVRAYTLGSAYADFRENELGSITVGKLADLVVLDKNIFTIPLRGVLSTSVLMTVMDGKIVYRKK
ncbi:MAG TPA: amidohydrolase [candidate division Zixibacteria bacterium]|nr:amidohydrolase [candidate division Zixibacteria bacterium]